MMKDNLIPFKEDPSIARDPRSGAVLNTNTEAYLSHLNAKKQKMAVESRVLQLESTVNDMKTMLTTILEAIQNGSNRS